MNLIGINLDDNPITAIALNASYPQASLNTATLSCRFELRGPLVNSSCSCGPGQFRDVACGYVRCFGSVLSCPPGTITNTTDCSSAPYPRCTPHNEPGCAFHCGTNRCGSPTIEIFPYEFNYGTDEAAFRVISDALDLRGRGITSLLPGAFECWTFDTYSITDLDADDQFQPSDEVDPHPESGTTSGILLDSNPLRVLPRGTLFNGAPLVSLNNCSITALEPGAFGGTITAPELGYSSFRGFSITFVFLDNNEITTLPTDLFSGLGHYWYLAVSLQNNHITTPLSQEFFGIAEGYLFYLDLTGNAIDAVATPLATPRQGFVMSSGEGLFCESFSKTQANGFGAATNCSCASGFHLSLQCGYRRCTRERNGCPANFIINSTNCSVAPRSACVAGGIVPDGQYYNLDTGAFLPLSKCETEYSHHQRYVHAYEFAPPTITSDRLCSICSVCPAEYVVSAT